MKKVLIIGAGAEQVQAIEMAKEMGYYVICSDYNPKAPGVPLVDEFHEISTNDVEGNLKLVQDTKVDGILTVCSETAVPVIGKICDATGLIGVSYDTAMKATNKGDMRKAMEEYGVEMPARELISTFAQAENFIEKYSGPWVLKPSDSSGQRGTNLVHEREDLKWAFESAEKEATDNLVLIDQFIEGQEINVCAVVKNGEATILSLADRDTLPSPHFGIAVLHSAPPSINEAQAELVKKMAVDSMKAIGLENGIGYPQIIVTKDGPKLIEVAARMPGGHNREMALFLSGVDMVKFQIMVSMGEDFSIEDLKENQVYPAASIKLFTELNFPNIKGDVKSISGIDDIKKLPNVKDCYVNLSVGKPLPALTFSGGRFGAVITVGNSKAETLELNEKSTQLLIIE